MDFNIAAVVDGVGLGANIICMLHKVAMDGIDGSILLILGVTSMRFNYYYCRVKE